MTVNLSTGEMTLRKPISELEAKAFAAFRKEKASLLAPATGTDEQKTRYMRGVTETLRAFIVDYRRNHADPQ